jgi:hypothetical protein
MAKTRNKARKDLQRSLEMDARWAENLRRSRRARAAQDLDRLNKGLSRHR